MLNRIKTLYRRFKSICLHPTYRIPLFPFFILIKSMDYFRDEVLTGRLTDQVCYRVVLAWVNILSTFKTWSPPKKHPKSVLHVNLMVHTAYIYCQILREEGYKADYLAISPPNKTWGKSDFVFMAKGKPHQRLWQEFRFFWKKVATYEIIHLHFMQHFTQTGWELKYFKKAGGKIVVHYRGCRVRDKEKNKILQPNPIHNICHHCDYNASICSSPKSIDKQRVTGKYGDFFLATTPDLTDFDSRAVHFPFFAPISDNLPALAPTVTPETKDNEAFKIVHVTNHPGIEGTELIQKAIDNLMAKGFNIDFNFLKGVSYEEALASYQNADLSIGKMKMGYYANAQIESMFFGVPTVTYIRKEFRTEALENSGLIITDLDDLEKTLEYYISHPEALAQKQKIARSSILELHDNHKLAQRNIEIYQALLSK